MCENAATYDAANGFYGKWLEENRVADKPEDKLAEEARRLAEMEREAKTSVKIKSLQPTMSVGTEHVCSRSSPSRYM